MSQAPQKRDDLEVNESADGLIVYDGRRDRVHHLNGTASLVFELCTGEHDDARIAGLVVEAFPDDDAEVVTTEVGRCLETLRTEELVR